LPVGGADALLSGIGIDYTTVSIWPILGLRERIGKVMREEVVGEFDPDQVERWEEDDQMRDGEKGSRFASSDGICKDDDARGNKRRRLDRDTTIGPRNKVAASSPL
jgi:hypothetical protein